MLYTLENIREYSLTSNPVKRSKVIGEKGIYILLQDICIKLSNGDIITIPKWFRWDLASVPQIFQNIVRESGDDDIAYLIHDYLYKNKIYTRKFSDDEMLKWAKAMRETKNISLRNLDIRIRYIVVRALGCIVWRDGD
tara:strand:- start:761 stop:1174 length:414 start_codon:yes stop_codon:yes gene_type:complete